MIIDQLFYSQAIPEHANGYNRGCYTVNTPHLLPTSWETPGWELHETVPGAGFWMTLAADGSSISGTGTVLVEAGGGGTATIEGAVVGDVVNLDITYQIERPGGTTTLTEHFAGRLLFDELVGTTQAGDPPNASSERTVFIRTN